MGFTLRAAPSGKVIRGTASGQTIVYNAVTTSWDVGDTTPMGVYQFASLDDLEAAFPAQGGVHLLDESAVYQFVGPGFDIGANRIQVSGAGAILEGQGATTIAGQGTFSVIIMAGAQQTVRNLNVENTGPSASAIRCALEVTSSCDVWGGRFSVLNDASAIVCSGNAELTLTAVDAVGTLADVRYSSGELTMLGCRLLGAGPGLQIAGVGGAFVQLAECWCAANKAYGIVIEGSVAKLDVIGCNLGSPVDSCILRNSGTVGSCSVIGGYLGGAVGIDWAASIPTRGLLLVGADISAATPFVGFDETTARVNIKACSNAGGLAPETPIVA
jgi:hypothetical protein